MTTSRRHDRHSLDELVARVRDPGFASSFCRPPSLRRASAHVSPVMLAAVARDSLYVAEWRDHARRCPPCARLFAYFGLA